MNEFQPSAVRPPTTPRAVTLIALGALALACLATPGGILAQMAAEGPSETDPGVRAAATGVATRVDVGPTIDGRLDDPVWLQAQPLTGFVQYEPVSGSPVSEHTEVRIVFDDDALYVGAWLLDEESNRIIVGERRRNANLNQSDAFLVVLDTYMDRQNGFVFGTNPGGIEYDGQVRGGGGVNTNWDGSWSVATSQDAQGWYVEMRIPFSTLRYGPDEIQTWGLNVARYIGRKNEQAFWSPVPRQFNLYRLTEAGTLSGVAPPPQRVMTFTPYVLGGAQRGLPGMEGTERPFEVGADAKFGITASLALDLTVNTDFAQVEVDDQQVDLSRFNLFFPERRPFFLENADLFSAASDRPGSSATPVQMFHSRRIGVHGGQEVPIQGGARVSGRVGGTDVGFLHMRTDGLEGVQDANGWTVGRVVRELPNRSRVGAIFTARGSSDTSGDHNRLYGMDARLGIGDEWTLDMLAGITDTPGLEGDRRLLAVVGEYRSQDWQLSAFYDHIGDAFNPEVGFLRRSAFTSYHLRAMRFVRFPQVSWLREMRPHTSYTVSHDLGGFKETERVHMHSHIEFENGALAMPALDWELEGLSRPFRIAGTNIEVPPGTYSGWTFWSSQNTTSQAPIQLTSRFEVGSFFTGDRVQLSGGVAVRRGGTLTGNVNLTHNRISLPEGDFNTTLTRVRLRYAFSPSLALQSSVQYSDQTGVWTGHVRFGWIDTAGTGLFLVYNERHVLDIDGVAGVIPRDGLIPPERTFVIKFTRQFDVSGWASGMLD
jgi:hypothetical protein